MVVVIRVHANKQVDQRILQWHGVDFFESTLTEANLLKNHSWRGTLRARMAYGSSEQAYIVLFESGIFWTHLNLRYIITFVITQSLLHR
jgi:hypothetical protein